MLAEIVYITAKQMMNAIMIIELEIHLFLMLSMAVKRLCNL